MVAISATLGFYQYNAEQIRQAGFTFGNDLQQIQDDIKLLQDDFYLSIKQWEEGDIDKENLISRLRVHVEEFDVIMLRYDTLSPPSGFEGAVDLFQLSSQAQLGSDVQYIKWLETGEESAKIRSDLQLTEAFELELAALSEYNKVRDGVQ